VPKLAGINHLRAIRALEKAGFRIIRQGAHVMMGCGSLRLVIPRANPIDAYTMGSIVKKSGLTIEEFKELL
jgi:predicted RNA binding protein YcfA (HicA-like mRNA interferase family)